MIQINRRSALFILSALVLSFPVAKAQAQEAAPQASPPVAVAPAQTDLLPVMAASDSEIVIDESSPTHPSLKLTPDRSELVRLDRKAASVIVGNPAHLSILPEGSNTLVLVPQAPGATYFTVLDEQNKIIMQRHVIVASPKEKYVRIRKSCGGNADCRTTQVYYCPDMCHEIIMNGAGKTASNGSNGKKANRSMDTVDPTEETKAGEPSNDGEETTDDQE